MADRLVGNVHPIQTLIRTDGEGRYDVIFSVWPVLTRCNGVDPMNGLYFDYLHLFSAISSLAEYIACRIDQVFHRGPARDLACWGTSIEAAKKSRLA
jgi:hypothetical protein